MPMMKDSGINDVGLVPNTWITPKIGYYFSFRSGDSLTSLDIDDTTGDYKVYGANGIRGYYSKCNTHGKHILLGRVGALCGNVHIIDGENWVTEHALILSRKKKCVEEYCGYLFKTLNLGQYSKSSAQPVISVETISQLKFVIPPLSEQKKIAGFLDSKCAEIDALSADIQKEIETLEEYKRSVIAEAVTKGLDPNAEMKDSGISWIGQIPKHWTVYRIADLYQDRNERGNDELPLLTVSINSGVSDKELGKDEAERNFIRSEDKTKYKRVYPGDLTYNMMRAWQGSMGAVRVDGMVSPAYVVAKPTGTCEIDSRFIEALLRSPLGIEEMNRYSYGIMDFRKRLYWPQFRIIKVALPGIEEQRKIADYIDTTNRKIDDIVSAKVKQLSTLEEYKKSLIYEYVTGKKEVPSNNA